MANEYLLKMIVNGLGALAADSETLYEHLDLRAAFHGYEGRFEAAPYVPPEPPYDDTATLVAAAADLMGRIADNSALFLRYLGGTPVIVDDFADASDDADLLRVILDWGTVQAGTFRTIVQLYGLEPAPPPGLPNPGAATEQRLWAEAAAWFTKIACDTDCFSEVQEFPAAQARSIRQRIVRSTAGGALARVEQRVRRATLNTLQIAGFLPPHLHHAAQAGSAGSARTRQRRRRTRS